jgi:hypothetical protein
MKNISTASLRTMIMVAAIGISPIANAADATCGSSAVYFSDWPTQEWGHTLLSKSSSGGYVATTVVTKTEPCRLCDDTTEEKHGPIPLPAGQYRLFDGKLLFWDRDRWVAIGHSVNPYWLGAPELWSYENVLQIHSSPVGDGKGQCVSAQIRGLPDQLGSAGLHLLREAHRVCLAGRC